jgi:histidinol dehydrogenase
MQTITSGLFLNGLKAAEETAGGAAAQEAAREAVRETVRGIIRHVRESGAAALREYSAQFDHVELKTFEAAAPVVRAACERLRREEPALFNALMFVAANIRSFARLRKNKFIPL